MKAIPTFHIVTLFPELVEPWLTTSILGRAHEKKGLFHFKLYPLRDFATDKHRSVDDVAYGGGRGMVLKAEPLVAAVESIRTSLEGAHSLTIYFSPAGTPISQPLLTRFEKDPVDHFILICGRYEGVDQRFIDHWVDLEVSLGDFVITGGELPAIAFVDALVRKLQGVLPEEACHQQDSFSLRGEAGAFLLEYPHYTRPAEFRGKRVPDILLSGDHAEIESWRKTQATDRTRQRRPDLLDNH